ncbi:uncharacterized protein LOC141901019 [Tubulanus polymorphus]|uniref:uncharacterized protein LOC141901019 n=1 Tax=Tubulanus polymorphus TaxID=672921 RepID=UPI003DA6A79D
MAAYLRRGESASNVYTIRREQFVRNNMDPVGMRRGDSISSVASAPATGGIKSILKKRHSDTPPASVIDPCRRCLRRVYPVDRVRIEFRLLYHKECFNCKTCQIKLTLKNFLLSSGVDREIYCSQHVPRATLGNSHSFHSLRTYPPNPYSSYHNSVGSAAQQQNQTYKTTPRATNEQTKKQYRTSFSDEIQICTDNAVFVCNSNNKSDTGKSYTMPSSSFR